MSTGTLEAVKIADAELLKQVDVNKTYRFTLQFGSNRRWRNYGPGKVKVVERIKGSGRDGDQVQLQLQPALHDAGPFSGRLVNGLIEAHNKFLTANRQREGNAGKVDKMILLSNIREVDEMPEDDLNSRRGGVGGPQMQMVRAIVSETLKEVLPEIVKAVKGGGGNRGGR